MQRKQFMVTLREDAVLSQSAVTTGAHRHLDYLPGSAFLGAVASHLYEKFQQHDPELAWQVFHSGKVRFGNALPLQKTSNKHATDFHMAYPVPLSWYYPKNTLDEPNDANDAMNFSQADFPDGFQLQQYRGKYSTMHSDGYQFFSPKSAFRMKTAIQPDKGIAAESQLFGYSSLNAGQHFSFALEADDDVDSEVFSDLAQTLLNEAIFIGRSRSAEFGAVSISSAPAEHAFTLCTETTGVTVWCLSDAVVLDQHGIPTLQPSAEDLGLPHDWQLDIQHSFVAKRRYAPYNAKYQRRELEREAIGMGSVLRYAHSEDSQQQLPAETLLALQTSGIGSYRQAGLGRICVNPELFNDDEPNWQYSAAQFNPQDSQPQASACQPETHLLYRYLSQRMIQQEAQESINTTAQEWADTLPDLYRNAKAFLPYVQANGVGPTATQWGAVMDTCKRSLEATPGTTATQLSEILGQGEHAICKVNDPQWGLQIVANSQHSHASLSTFREWFLGKIKDLDKNAQADAIHIVARFARLAMNVANQQHSASAKDKG